MAEVTALVSAYEASGILGMDRSSVLELIHAGVLGQVYESGRREYVTHQRVEEVATWTPPPTTRALIVRVKPAVPDPSAGRKWVGWSTQLTPDERLDGVRGFWRVADPDAWAGAQFFATISGVVVEACTIDQGVPFEHFPGGLVRFNVTREPDQALTHARWKPQRGGLILRIEG